MQRNARNPLILDGSLGHEMEKRGFNFRLPLWSTWALMEAPDLIREIYRDYLQAGADVLTTATFRTARYSLEKEGIVNRFAELNRVAVQIGRDAVAEVQPGREITIAGSIAPIEDCYSPELAPADNVMEREHHALAEMLAESGADLLLVETQNSRREAVIATNAALSTGLPVWTSLMPRSANEMFNGDPLLDTAHEVIESGVDALLINCCELRIAAQAFANLRKEFPDTRLGVYPNDLEGVVTPKLFADWAMQLIDKTDIIGGCCGIGPVHIKALSKPLESHS